MIVALALLSLISIIALTSSYILTSSVSRNTEFGNSMRSDAAAESGINLGLIAVKDEGVGVDLPQNHVCFPDDGDASEIVVGPGAAPTNTSGACADNAVTYSVISTAQNLDETEATDTYIIPPPGQGNAGSDCNVQDNYYNPAHPLDDNLNKPCNWNKLHFGETVQIPLYQEDGSTILNPDELGMSEFVLKVRTPCIGGIVHDPPASQYLATTDENDWCPLGRYDLYNPPGDVPTDIIAHWQIVGDCDYSGPGDANTDYDGACVGIPNDQGASFERSDIVVEEVNYVNSSNSDYQLVYPGRSGVKDLNTNYIIDTPPHAFVNYLLATNNYSGLLPGATTSRELSEPTFHLTVVTPLLQNNPPTFSSVPYIEYQVVTNVPISDSAQTVTAIGTSGKFQKMLRSGKPNETTNIEFVIQN